MRAEATLGTDSYSFQSFLLSLPGRFCDDIGCFEDSLLDLFFVFQRTQFRADYTDYYVFVLGKMLERFEAACALSIVF